MPPRVTLPIYALSTLYVTSQVTVCLSVASSNRHFKWGSQGAKSCTIYRSFSESGLPGPGGGPGRSLGLLVQVEVSRPYLAAVEFEEQGVTPGRARSRPVVDVLIRGGVVAQTGATGGISHQ